MIKNIAFTLLAVIALAAGANAQILAGFDVAGSGGSSQGPGSPNLTTDASVSSTNLARTTVTFASLNSSFNSANWNTGAYNPATNYISFDVTAGSAPVTFSNLQYAIDGTGTAPNQGMWAYTLDAGITLTLQTTFTNTSTAPTALTTWDFSDFTLAATATVEFRFYEFGTTSIGNGTPIASSGAVRIINITGDDLVVNGPLAVPEPTTLAMVAGTFGLLGFVIARRQLAA